ncbi:MAG: ester cyclase [Paraburkholderia sp.]|uniref:ester cyclase n=1 Tax=Paraburkholderia sp. TaxID=1926495 RepID=UPI003C571EAC
MDETNLSELYRGYIACLNRQDWANLGRFVGDKATHNGKEIGLAGYRQMLEKDFREIPDLHFEIQMLVCEPPFIASRLQFACTPESMFLGLHIDGRKVTFAENVFYEFNEGKIQQVWSVIDKGAIEAQL